MDLLQVIVSGLLLGGVYALFAVGMNMIFGVLRVINLAHGELIMLGAYATFFLVDRSGFNPLLTIPFSAAALFVAGVAVEKFLIERTVNQPILSSLLLTFGLSTFLMGGALYLWTANFRSVPYLTGSYDIGALDLSKIRLVSFVIALTVTGATFGFLRYATYGKAIRATAQHAEVAQVCGINVGRVRLTTFGLGSALAATSGSLIAMIFTVSPEMGRMFIGRAFAIVVLGGLGSFEGALLGALLLGVAETVAAYYTDTQLAEGVSYAVLVLVLLLRPSGLFGVKE
jgi:branched-chain amino acid transport system permease protein